MSDKPSNTFDTTEVISNYTSSSNSKSIKMDNLKPSCSKELINCDLKNNCDGSIKPYNIKYAEEMENNTIMPLPQLPHPNYHSDYEIYEDKNNCMLTNLYDFGLRYFNINTDDETVEKYTNDNHSDSSINDIEEIFKHLSQDFDKGSSKEAEVDESGNVLNENIDILNLDGLQKHVNETCYSQDSTVDSYQYIFQQNIIYEEHEHLEESNNRPKYCDEYPELDQDYIEQVLKCNLFTKVCATHTVNEIPNDRENILINDNKFSDLHNVINDHDILVNSESKDCLLVNDKEIIESASNLSEIKSDSTDACSYHSSDFEFIDEEEAKKECKLNIGPIIDKVKNVGNNTIDFDDNYTINDYFSKTYQANDNSIPSGNDYHNLFLIQNIPFSCMNIEHKALSSIKGMEVSSGNNTDLKYLFQGDPKYIEEAEKTIQIILSMYPTENKTAHNRRSY